MSVSSISSAATVPQPLTRVVAGTPNVAALTALDGDPPAVESAESAATKAAERTGNCVNTHA